MDNELKGRLEALADEKYKAFMETLLPGVKNIIGVRLPELQRLAKELAECGRLNKELFKNADSYEETLLEGLTIGNLELGCEQRLALIAEFVPKIDNWAVCDSFCGSLKFAKKNRERVFEFLQPYLVSGSEFDVRFAVVMLLDYYANEAYKERTMHALKRVKHDGYYAKMAVAWAFSVMAAYFPEETLKALADRDVDGFTRNKAIQKITESRRVDPAVKQLAKELRKRISAEAAV